MKQRVARGERVERTLACQTGGVNGQGRTADGRKAEVHGRKVGRRERRGKRRFLPSNLPPSCLEFLPSCRLPFCLSRVQLLAVFAAPGFGLGPPRNVSR